MDTAYILVNPKSKEAKSLILLENPKSNSLYPCDSCAILALDTFASGYRLPFYYEWFYLARAGASTKYHWGDEEDSLTVSAYEWVRPTKLIGSKEGTLKPVAQLRPNQFGLYDMLGITHEFWESEDGSKGSFCWGGYPECVLTKKIAPRYQYMGKTGGYCTILYGEHVGCVEEKDTLTTGTSIYKSFRLVRKTPKLHKLEKF